MNCPKCGSNPVGGVWKSFFECGTFQRQTDNGFHHTVLCGQFAQLRKPLDAQIQKLESERDALKARVQMLDEALVAYQEAYTPDGHVSPHDCFSTGPKTGNGFQDHVWCPGCYAESLAKKAKEAKP